MSYDYVTMDAMKNASDWFITKPEEVPDYLHQKIFNTEKGNHREFDALTPFLKSKEWLYEETARFQPRTGKLLLEGSQLFISMRKTYYSPQAMIEKDATKVIGINVNLIQEVNGMVVEIPRSFWGSNISDDNYNYNPNWENRCYSFSEPLRKSYYTRFMGLNIPNMTSIGIYPRLLPRNNNSWDSIEGYLKEVKQKKYLAQMVEMFPGIRKKVAVVTYNGFMSFLDTRPLGDEVFFIKNHIQDGVIYCLKKGDVPNMQILNNPVEAIDLYCEHVLLRREGKFDFTPFLTPFKA
jgi:hypothetical protein